MTENSLVTGRVFTKLFFSFVVVLFLGMTVLDFSLRQVMEQSLRTQVEESLGSEARLLATHIRATASPAELQQIARTDAAAAEARRQQEAEAALQRVQAAYDGVEDQLSALMKTLRASTEVDNK